MLVLLYGTAILVWAPAMLFWRSFYDMFSLSSKIALGLGLRIYAVMGLDRQNYTP